MQSTPLRGRKIGRILVRSFSSIVVLIYGGGAADAQGVSPRSSTIYRNT
jgi:hypothetical protein